MDKKFGLCPCNEYVSVDKQSKEPLILDWWIQGELFQVLVQSHLEVLPLKRPIGMCCWMGLHFHHWITRFAL